MRMAPGARVAVPVTADGADLKENPRRAEADIAEYAATAWTAGSCGPCSAAALHANARTTGIIRHPLCRRVMSKVLEGGKQPASSGAAGDTVGLRVFRGNP